ncbi:hypothetical protein [Methylococcus sp. EFPC2]|uniref:hypothetical protein n=1 Tax=Methylococcus sp. EFPC2 TaxID=2812648 RepID=UPI001967567F|nr:hypothetical protein [Methylococcus sp. EFPC2]QSA96454.1 hypothetical protein JWZ97_14695 [Methylococcus sp. EFPC2]
MFYPNPIDTASVTQFRKVLCVLAGLMLSSVFQTASASLITAHATLDWSSLTVTPIDTGSGLPTLTWYTRSDNSNLSSNFYSGLSDSAASWTSGTLTSQTNITSRYTLGMRSSTSTATLSTESSLTTATGGYLSQYWNEGSERSGSFRVQGDGVLLFQINYAVDADTDSTRAGSVTTNAWLAVSTSSVNSSNFGSETAQSNKTLYNRSSGSNSLTDSGVLTVALFFHDGWFGNITGKTYINGYVNGSEGSGGGGGSVPVPSLFWLFCASLGGLLRLAKRPTALAIG